VTLSQIELASLEAFRSGSPAPERVSGETDAWIGFGIVQLLIAARALRSAHLALRENVEIKEDGSPTVLVEKQIEVRLREALAEFAPSAAIVGEETGGVFPSSGLAVAIDPVDGTWAFVTGTETYTTVLTLFRDAAPLLGFILNPTTGELGYAVAGGSSRLLQLSLFGEPDAAVSLPATLENQAKVLVNIHPSRAAAGLVHGCYDAWRRDDVQTVRSPGGSPSWALLEAAKGAFVYANVWGKRPAEPYDLAAGALLVRGAGGDITDLDGRSIDATRHEGPFVAGIDDAARSTVAGIARKTLGT
jgi:fructose-1,6-bisphosphatase/inositol monophosphatase family enzyme